MQISALIKAYAQTHKSADALSNRFLVTRETVRSTCLADEVPSVALTPVEASEQLPIIIHLDGGVGDRERLVARQELISALTEVGVLPPALHLSFSGGATDFYADRWHDWVVEELPAWATQTFGVECEADRLALTGISAGGHGALRIAFSAPERFRAVAAMAPVLIPSFDWPLPHTRPAWWLLEDAARSVWGEPFPARFCASQPANIVRDNAQAIRTAQLNIYLEVGDVDLLGLQDGAEFLHRVLWQHDLLHEFHLVRWGDHGGRSIDDRFVEAMAFLSAALSGAREESREDPTNDLHGQERMWAPLKTLAEGNDPAMQRALGRIPQDVG